ncbi:MAG: hypothetical protein KDK30_10575 [Leptospiraceae bacterium]|nr:hypothetical protein [Leptospiraceae bacterium]MCB1314781.1 hypothetical protein [Leptospiraceae bacterium]
MKTILEKESRSRSGQQRFGPDPVLMKKQGLAGSQPREIKEFKARIKDPAYMDHAINRIAMELMHFLVK